MSNQEEKKRKYADQTAAGQTTGLEADKAENLPLPDITEEQNAATLLEGAQKLAEQAAAEKEQLVQANLRLQADFDNFRKRSRQERDDIIKLANAALILSLLPVLDNFERALNALPESSERAGVQLIHRQLLEALAVAGLSPIEAVGAAFDPQLHEAVLQSDAGPEHKGLVVGEAQKGYLLNGKLLRVSQVQVGG